jgi:ferrous iron transport protein A
MYAPSEPLTRDCMTLADLPLRTIARVHSIRGRSGDGDLQLRLLEIGFVENEQVRVIAHGFPGHEPIAVRIGGTTFALRRFEAECIVVRPCLEPE